MAYLGKEMPVVEAGDFAAEGVEVHLTSHECASEPAWEQLIRFVGVVAGECIDVGAERGVGWSIAVRVPCNMSIVELFDPFGWVRKSCIVWNEEARGTTVVLFVAVGGGVSKPRRCSDSG
jgi:hypothetical protein